MTPRVTIVIPCYNDGALLLEALESLRAQELCAVVVVDDGSDARETLEILARLAREGVAVYRIPNSGPSAARNFGLWCSTTDYVFPLDADDLLAPGALTALADALDANPGAALAWGDEETFGNEVVYRRSMPTFDAWRLTYVNEIPDAMIRRDAALLVGGWDESNVGYEDWDMWLSLAEEGAEGIYVPRLVCRYRLHCGRRFRDRSVKRHDLIMAHFWDRHPGLFKRRSSTWRRSGAPWRMKLLFPLVERLPLISCYSKQCGLHFVGHPARHIGQWARRARARLAC